ncbi:MAG: ABC transporter ATP-binding protein [Planctomycetes bacterium]|nr:ABC transporter ATP-binding protein [Planctomycetota bacterium]
MESGRDGPGELRAASVSFAYGERLVLAGVDLAIRAGEFVGLLGPNGAGKTTLIRLLGGLARPTSGCVQLGGVALGARSRREIARAIAFVPQESATFFPLRAREAVALGRFPHRGGLGFENEADRAAIHAAMEATDTTALADRYLHELSGGERQRVLLARALAQAPSLLLLDEPTSHLDLRHQERFLELIDRSRRPDGRDGRTVVFVSHDVNLIAHRASRLVLLAAGRVVADGPPAAVLTAERLSAVYETALRLVPDARSDVPFVFPEPRSVPHAH